MFLNQSLELKLNFGGRRKDDRGDATGAFEMFVAEEPSSMVQEPRNSFSRGGLALAQMLLKNLNIQKIR